MTDKHFKRMLDEEAATRERHQGRELPPVRSGGGADGFAWPYAGPLTRAEYDAMSRADLREVGNFDRLLVTALRYFELAEPVASSEGRGRGDGRAARAGTSPEVPALRAALRKYGHHTYRCEIHLIDTLTGENRDCSCGLDALLAERSEATPVVDSAAAQRSAPAGDGVSDEEVRRAVCLYHGWASVGVGFPEMTIMRGVLDDFIATRKTISDGKSAGRVDGMALLKAVKLTPTIERAIVRCEEEIQARKMGEPSAHPVQAFMELLALLAAAAEPQGQSTSHPATPPTPAIEDVRNDR